MAPHSSTLAWKIPWMEEPGRLQSMGSLRVGHDWATSLSLFTFIHWRRNGNPLQCSCLENPRDGVAWWAAVYGVTQSRTWLKQLSSSSSIHISILFKVLFSIWVITKYGVEFPKRDKKLIRSNDGGVKVVETLRFGHPQLLSVICDLG